MKPDQDAIAEIDELNDTRDEYQKLIDIKQKCIRELKDEVDVLNHKIIKIDKELERYGVK